jgi:NAD(P)-dependent dehydrogenase (short-subunit alcohol dehydrogenase family)
MNLNLTGKKAVVTGGSLGIGYAIAETLLKEGCSVTISGRTENNLEAAMRKLSKFGELKTLIVDHSIAKDDLRFSQEIELLEPDIFIANVGYFESKPFFEIGDDDWTSMWNLNVITSVRHARAVMPAMLKNGAGRLILISSEAGAKPWPDMLHYSVSKAAQHALARGLGEMTKGTAVTVNSVMVAPTWTEGVEQFLGKIAVSQNKKIDEVKADFFSRPGLNSLIGRFAKPIEIANVVAFLASDLSAVINGTVQRADGGIYQAYL